MSAAWGGSSSGDNGLSDELSRALVEATATARAQVRNGPDPETVAHLLEVADRLETTTKALAQRVQEIRDEHFEEP